MLPKGLVWEKDTGYNRVPFKDGWPETHPGGDNVKEPARGGM